MSICTEMYNFEIYFDVGNDLLMYSSRPYTLVII